MRVNDGLCEPTNAGLCFRVILKPQNFWPWWLKYRTYLFFHIISVSICQAYLMLLHDADKKTQKSWYGRIIYYSKNSWIHEMANKKVQKTDLTYVSWTCKHSIRAFLCITTIFWYFQKKKFYFRILNAVLRKVLISVF